MARFLKDKKKAIGLAPGSLVFIGHQKIDNPKVNILQYNSEFIKERDISSLENLDKYISDDYITWISLHGLHDTNLMDKIGQEFDVNSLFMEDALNTDERPKFMDDDEHLYVIMKSMSFDKESTKVSVEQVAIIVGKNYIITMQESERRIFGDVLKRIKDGRTRIRSLSTDYLCYTLMDTLVDHYIYIIETIGGSIEEQEKFLLDSDKSIIEKIYRNKTEIAYIRKNIRPVKELINRFLVCDSNLINSKTLNYLKDLEGLTTQSLEAIEIYFTMISDQQNSYNANMSNNVNAVMKVLTIFSAVFIPLTFLAGEIGRASCRERVYVLV